MSTDVTTKNFERTYTWLGKTFPISMSHLTDEMMASRVRMLMRDELPHEAVCVAARDRIMCLSAEKAALREALANTVCYGCDHRIGDEAPHRHTCVSCKSKRELLARSS